MTVIPDPPEGYEWKRPQDLADDDEVTRRLTLLAVKVRPKRIRQWVECDDTPENRQVMETRTYYPSRSWSYGPVEEVE